MIVTADVGGSEGSSRRSPYADEEAAARETRDGCGGRGNGDAERKRRSALQYIE